MPLELIVTSAERGVRSGRSGFQPVARTRGMRDDVTAQIERQAGYRHVLAPGQPGNPVVFSFRTLRTSQGELRVLSRTVDAGTDYSRRSNKLAHLVAVRSDELPQFLVSSPAAVIQASESLLVERWSGVPEERAAEPALSRPNVATAVCAEWGRVTGDAGWAGVLAARAIEGKPTLIVARDAGPQASRQLLALFAEASGLLPPERRWETSFETLTMGASTSLWQGTYAGSPEAASLRPGTRVIDLTKPGALPQEYAEHPLVRAARSGRREQSQPRVSRAKPFAPPAQHASSGVQRAEAGGFSEASSGPPLLMETKNRRRSELQRLEKETGSNLPLAIALGGVALLVLALPVSCIAISVIGSLVPRGVPDPATVTENLTEGNGVSKEEVGPGGGGNSESTGDAEAEGNGESAMVKGGTPQADPGSQASAGTPDSQGGAAQPPAAQPRQVGGRKRTSPNPNDAVTWYRAYLPPGNKETLVKLSRPVGSTDRSDANGFLTQRILLSAPPGGGHLGNDVVALEIPGFTVTSTDDDYTRWNVSSGEHKNLADLHIDDNSYSLVISIPEGSREASFSLGVMQLLHSPLVVKLKEEFQVSSGGNNQEPLPEAYWVPIGESETLAWGSPSTPVFNLLNKGQATLTLSNPPAPAPFSAAVHLDALFADKAYDVSYSWDLPPLQVNAGEGKPSAQLVPSWDGTAETVSLELSESLQTCVEHYVARWEKGALVLTRQTEEGGPLAFTEDIFRWDEKGVEEKAPGFSGYDRDKFTKIFSNADSFDELKPLQRYVGSLVDAAMGPDDERKRAEKLVERATHWEKDQRVTAEKEVEGGDVAKVNNEFDNKLRELDAMEWTKLLLDFVAAQSEKPGDNQDKGQPTPEELAAIKLAANQFRGWLLYLRHYDGLNSEEFKTQTIAAPRVTITRTFDIQLGKEKPTVPITLPVAEISPPEGSN